MPHRCSIGFRSGDMLGQSITFTLSLFSKAVVLQVCLVSLSCWNTALRPSFWGEGVMLCFSMSQCMLAFMVPQWTVASQCRQHSCSPRPWHSHHHAWLQVRHTCLCTPHLVAATHTWHHEPNKFILVSSDHRTCVLSYFEGTVNLHYYKSCTLTTLHCSKVSFLQCCPMKRWYEIFTKMWGVYSLLWYTVYIFTILTMCNNEFA